MLMERLKAKAYELGFSMVGVVSAEPSRHLYAYKTWIANEMHGKMGYLARPDRLIRREDLNVILPDVRTMICVGLDYYALKLPANIAGDPSRGRISNYAWGVDYHAVMTPRLEALGAWLAAELQEEVRNKVYVDTGAILERSHAEDAGFGFVGKNTMLINPRRGSFFFLGELLTTAALPPDRLRPPMPNCGRCTNCLTDCPTDAFPEPYVLDARRCISYLTIELKDWVPHVLRPLMGNWIYGCDVCQDVCPWNRFAVATGEIEFRPKSHDHTAPPLVDLLRLGDAEFEQRFANSPIKRIKRRRLIRNACVAAGNWGDAAVLPQLVTLLSDAEPLIRGHSAWAIGRIGRADGLAAVQQRLMFESDRDVRDEMRRVLA